MKVTLQGELFPNRKAVMVLTILMRIFNACKRFAYQRLLEGVPRRELKKILQRIFKLNSRYCDDAILQAQETLSSVTELGGNPKKVIWGSKRLYNKLVEAKKKNDRKKIRQLEKEWRDRRTGSLYSRGDKSKGGNLNLRIRQGKRGKFFLRINTGRRTWIEVPFFLGKKYAKKLAQELGNPQCLYTVEIIRRDGRYTILITLEEKAAAVEVDYSKGAIGVDLNAFPAHIAWAEIDARGNLVTAGKIGTPHLYDSRANKRTWWRGEYARQLRNLAQEKGKGLVIEDLNFARPKKKRVKSRKLRRIFSQFSYSALKKAFISQFARHGISLSQVWPAYTSIIGDLKYREIYSLSIHQAAAMVIARRSLDYKENWTKFLINIANCEGLVNGEPGGSTNGRNPARPLAGHPVGWSLWRALRKAVLTARSTKPSLRGRGP